jgi:hypothetical protein
MPAQTSLLSFDGFVGLGELRWLALACSLPFDRAVAPLDCRLDPGWKPAPRWRGAAGRGTTYLSRVYAMFSGALDQEEAALTRR